MEIVGYCEKYKNGVISCLKRNFKDLQKMSEQQVEEWLRPCISYSWMEDVRIEELPYKYGMVLLDEQQVVGYLGMVYSYIHDDEKSYLFVNPTTWAIDKKYSFHVFSAMNAMIDSADIIGDFTPSDEMHKICVDMYDFTPVDKGIIKFIPFPSLSKKVKMRYVTDWNEICDLRTQQEFKDHQYFHLRCLEIRSAEKTCYIFYKMIKSAIKGIKNIPYARVLNISNKELFCQSIHEIVWFIQKREWCFVEIDYRFVGEDPKGKGCLYKIVNNNKLMFSKLDKNVPINLLYSELAMLDQM